MLKWHHVAIRSIFVTYSALLFCWSLLALVKYFNYLSYWLAYDILYLCCGLVSVGFGFSSLHGKMNEDAKRARWFAIIMLILTVGSIGKNIALTVIVSIDLYEHTLPLINTAYWYVAAFVAILVSLLILDVCAFVRFIQYRIYLGIVKITHNPKIHLNDTIRAYHKTLRIIFFIYPIFLIVWSLLTLVDGFSDTLFNVSFWLGYEIVFVTVGLVTTGLDVRNGSNGSVSLDTRRSSTLSVFCVVLAIVALGKNIVHMVFAVYWFYAILIPLILMDFVILILLFIYRSKITITMNLLAPDKK